MSATKVPSRMRTPHDRLHVCHPFACLGWITFIGLSACTRTTETRTTETRTIETRSGDTTTNARTQPSDARAPSPEDGLPQPARVCFADDEAPVRAALAVPSRAGVWSPEMPIVEEHLNWTVEGAGCVEWPNRPGISLANCGSNAALPLVRRRLCMQ